MTELILQRVRENVTTPTSRSIRSHTVQDTTACTPPGDLEPTTTDWAKLNFEGDNMIGELTMVMEGGRRLRVLVVW